VIASCFDLLICLADEDQLGTRRRTPPSHVTSGGISVESCHPHLVICQNYWG